MKPITCLIAATFGLGFTAPALAQVDCADWNTGEFFEMATARDVTVCLTDGADVSARGESSITPLHWAAYWNENPAVIKALLAAGADPMARDEGGETPLHWAAYNKNPAVIRALLAAGADPMARTESGVTPLHRTAGFNGNPAVTQALLAAGADAAMRTAMGRTAWDIAQNNEKLKGPAAYWRLNDARFNAPETVKSPSGGP